MEPKVKEPVRINPNEDISNKPIKEWPTSDKIQAIVGGPIVMASKAGVFDKVWEALRNFYDTGKNYKGKIPPMIPKMSMTKDSKQRFNNGGYLH